MGKKYFFQNDLQYKIYLIYHSDVQSRYHLHCHCYITFNKKTLDIAEKRFLSDLRDITDVGMTHEYLYRIITNNPYPNNINYNNFLTFSDNQVWIQQ